MVSSCISPPDFLFFFWPGAGGGGRVRGGREEWEGGGVGGRIRADSTTVHGKPEVQGHLSMTDKVAVKYPRSLTSLPQDNSEPGFPVEGSWVALSGNFHDNATFIGCFLFYLSSPLPCLCVLWPPNKLLELDQVSLRCQF